MVALFFNMLFAVVDGFLLLLFISYLFSSASKTIGPIIILGSCWEDIKNSNTLFCDFYCRCNG